MLVLADLESTGADICAVIASLRQQPATAHIPVIAFALEDALQLQAAARRAGATLVVNDAALLNHLPQLLDQALQLE
jgi:CheY-like chemotaxis protein